LDLQDAKIQTETYLEYLIQHGFIWATTGRHIDVKTITLCSGSRFADGSVPSGSWCDGRLRVRKFSSVNAYDTLRAREVVSL
ncbi:hypothetical protein KKE14_01995, partial [Patescibacteria group bacterium]|nr:hypothetical protein [Patescibacteria group bacterium]